MRGLITNNGTRIIRLNYKLLPVVLLAILLLAGLVAFCGSGVEASGSQVLNDLEIGDKVVDTSWEWQFRTGNDYTYQTGDLTKPIIWIVVAKDHKGYGSGVTLLTEELIGKHTFDDQIGYSYNHWGDSGSNPSSTRGLRPWLNSSGIHAGEGFYHVLSDNFKSNIITTTLFNRDWAGKEYFTQDKIFIPSTTELDDLNHYETYPIGFRYQYFKGAQNVKRIAYLGDTETSYWTRSPSTKRPDYISPGDIYVRSVSSNGEYTNRWAYVSSTGVRPALNLKPETMVSINKNKDGAYEIIYQLNSDDELSSLVVDPGALTPLFHPSITSYSVNVGYDTESIDITALLSDENASLTIDGITTRNGVARTISLREQGTSTTIDIVVTAEDGKTVKTYTITVNRLKFAQTFADVPPDHPFFEEIETLAASGITTGFPDGTFRPSNSVTRQAMAAFLVRGLELDKSFSVPAVPTFSDVPLTHPFYEEIEALAASGITTGFLDGTFKPSNNVTRQAMAAFLYRGLVLEDAVAAEPSFSDVPLTHPFHEEIEALAAAGITTGFPDGTFRPSNPVTRQAMSAFLVRGLELED